MPVGGELSREVIGDILKEATGGRQPLEGDVLIFGPEGWTFHHSNRLPFDSVDEDFQLDLRQHTILVDTADQSVTISLPPAEKARGRLFVIKKTNVGANQVIIVPHEDELIDGNANHTLGAKNEVAIIQSSRKAWWIWNA